LECDADYFLDNGSDLAVCQQNGVVARTAFCKPGGCLNTSGTAQEFIAQGLSLCCDSPNCVAQVAEMSTCDLICPEGQTAIGQFICIMGELRHKPVCSADGTPTQTVTALTGAISVCVSPAFDTPLPDVTSAMFASDMKAAAAVAFGVSQSDFTEFDVSENTDANCVGTRRLMTDTRLLEGRGLRGEHSDVAVRRPNSVSGGHAPARRLTAVSARIDYTVIVYDASRVEELKNLLNTLDDPNNPLVQAFKAHLASLDYTVHGLATITPPQAFEIVLTVTPAPSPATTDDGDVDGGVVAAIVIPIVLLACCLLVCCMVVRAKGRA